MTETITHGIVGEVDEPNIAMSIGRAASEYQIRFVDDMPRSTLEKVAKAELRKMVE